MQAASSSPTEAPGRSSDMSGQQRGDMPPPDAAYESSDSDDDDETRDLCYDVLTWEECAIEEQQQYFSAFGDRDYNAFKPNEKLYLSRHVGFPLFGPPQMLPTSKNRYTGYSEEQLKTLSAVLKTIEDNQGSRDETLLATVFVSIQVDGLPMISVPVFRVPKYKGRELSDDVVFIDGTCRVYDSWDSYLSENTLPACRCCYPRGGVYQGDRHGRVKVEFCNSPAARLKGKVLSGADTATNVVALTAAGVTVASLAVPVAAGAVAAAMVGGVTAGVYGIFRSVGVLIDKYQHKQAVGLSDPEARSNWLSMAGGVLGVGSGAALSAVSSLAREGVVVGTISRAAVTTLNLASLVTNGACLVNNLHQLVQRGAAGELTKLEVFQFSLSFFFFTHSIVNFQTAGEAIRQSQKSVIRDFRKSLRSHRQRKAFRRLVKDTTRGMDGLEGKAKVIRGIKHIRHKDAFFSSLAKGRKEFIQNKAQVILTDKGRIRINDQIDIHPAQFSAMKGEHRQYILKYTRAMSKSRVARATFRNDLRQVLRQNMLHYSKLRARTKENIYKTFGAYSMKNIVVAGKGVFCDFKQVDMRMLNSLYQCFESNEMVQLFKTLSEMVKCSNAKEFIEIIEFLHKKTSESLNEMEASYQSARTEAQREDEHFDETQFDTIYGIVGDRKQHFQNVVVSTFNLAHNLRDLADEYSRFKKPGDLRTRENKLVLAGVHFMLRDFSKEGDMSESEILSTASEVLGIPVTNSNCEVVQEGDMISVCCFGEDIPARTVIIECTKENGIVTAKEQ